MHSRRTHSSHEANEADWIGTGIQECAACKGGVETDVCRVRDRESERSLNRLHLTDRSTLYQFLQLRRVRLGAIGKRFDERHAVKPGSGEHRPRLTRRRGQGLFTE